MRPPLALLAILAAAAGCSGEPSPPPPVRVRLALAPAAGSAWVRELQENIDGHLTVRSGGREEVHPLVKEEQRVLEDEVVESDGRQVARVRRKTVSWELKRRAPGGDGPSPVPVSLVGKTLVLRRTDFGTEIDGAEGASADELRANSLEGLESILSLPDHEVWTGETWTIDGDRVARVFGGDGSRGIKVREARGTARLDQVSGPVAVVSLRLDVEGALRALLDVDVAMEFQGSFQLDLDARTVTSMNLRATGRLSGEVSREGSASTYDGGFKISAKGFSRPR
jgi:hypothetical protein